MTEKPSGQSPDPNAPADAEAQIDSEVDSITLKTAKYLPVLEAMLIGAAAGFSALFLLEGIRMLGSWRIAMSSQYPAEIVLPGFGLIGGFLAGILVWIAPEVSGSGIPQVRALLNRINLQLDIKSAVVKLIGGVIALGSGLFMGREGPTVQVGAALAAQLSRWLPTSAEHRRQLIAAGAGAGLAAAFNAPIAGVIFVLEELLKEVTPSTVGISLVACFSSAVVENLFGNARAHSAITQAGKAVPLHLIDIGFFIILGLMCAFFGAVFNGLIMGFLKMYRQSKLPVVIRTAFAGLMTGMIVSMLPDQFHNYAQARQLINSGTVTPDLVPLLFIAFMFLVLLAYGSGAPGGLFAPSLALGSAIGYMVGFTHAQFTGTNMIDIFTQVGMGSFFGAVARVPLTATVIVFEMSGNFGLIPPLMIACIIGSYAAELLSKGSLYDLLMVWSGIHLHGPKAAEEAETIRVAAILRTRTRFVKDTATIKDAIECIRRNNSSGCPVLDGKKLIGVVTNKQLDLMEEQKIAADSKVTVVMKRNAVSVSPYDNLEDILFLFTRYGFEWLPVTDDNKYVGTVTRADVLQKLFPEGESAA